jgi:bacterioferritin-associated ferredoxin
VNAGDVNGLAVSVGAPPLRDADRFPCAVARLADDKHAHAMIVCSCNILSDSEVRRLVTDSRTPLLTSRQVYHCLGCSAPCGRCARTIMRIMREARASCDTGCACCVADSDPR